MLHVINCLTVPVSYDHINKNAYNPGPIPTLLFRPEDSVEDIIVIVLKRRAATPNWLSMALDLVVSSHPPLEVY